MLCREDKWAGAKSPRTVIRARESDGALSTHWAAETLVTPPDKPPDPSDLPCSRGCSDGQCQLGCSHAASDPQFQSSLCGHGNEGAQAASFLQGHTC